jgi:4-carboxymuconolactone decarboxylase
MGRIQLISSRDGLDDHQQEVFDWVVESRGDIIRPYQVLLHTPGLARPAAELGHQLRFEGTLSDHDRELAIITTARVHECGFEWESHLTLARSAGVADSTVRYLESEEGELLGRDETIVGFVREVCANSNVSDDRFAAVKDLLGESGVIELTALIGYYTLLGFVMRVADAC